MSSNVRIWIGFGAMCVGMFMAILDIQVVASSLTTIQSALRVPANKLSWIQTGYLIAEVVAIPLTGWLTRALSLRWLFAAATFGFTLTSIACASVSSIDPLIAIRVVQGFCGGMLIPSVFTSVFSMIPERHRVLATAIAGICAVLAPTVGPAVGGFLTQTFSWHWIFLVNVLPGFAVTALTLGFVRLGRPNLPLLMHIDYISVVLAAISLGTFELLLKHGPERHWQGAYVLSLAGIFAATGFLAVRQTLRTSHPFVDLRHFQQRSFAIGAGLSFVFGMGLYGSTYLLSVFLGSVRGYGPLVIGEYMIVSGASQLLVAPVAAVLEPRLDPRLLTAAGFGLFGVGLLTNSVWTVHTDFWGVFWPQVFRGTAVMLCILPTTRLALANVAEAAVADASALFNLMRNLGGAIGIAIVDTIIEQRTPHLFRNLATRLQAGDARAAVIVGLPTAPFKGHDMGPVDPITREMFMPVIRKAALTLAFNEAWLVVGGLFVLSLLALPFIGRKSPRQTELELLARGRDAGYGPEVARQ
jgi:DHA2 family multidrug resistance protein